jgi:subtilisin family serine protease
MIRVPKGQRGTAISLVLVAGGALAFAAFGALGFSALAVGSSVVAALNAIPLVGDILAHGTHASAALPLVASMALAPVVGLGGPPLTPPAPPQGAKPVELVVKLNGTAPPLSADLHLSFADPRTRKGFAQYRQIAERMYAQLQDAGLGRGDLDSRGVAPVATYERINTATFRVADPARAAEVRAWLESQGHTVYQDVRRSIVRPVPPPADPAIRRDAVTMEENLQISRATSVHKIARQLYGDPNAGLITRLALRLVGAVIPQVKHAVIDTGIDPNHSFLKGIAEKNVTSQSRLDDEHGSWTQGTVTLFAPWSRKSATHYKAFVGGNASLDDILKALTMAANDGNLVISNSWGDDEGDPYSPDSQMVRKLAEEGHIMVFAAGNAGPRKNTVGNPGGVVFKDPKTGALRVLSITAAKRDKSVDYFSSRGPRPRKVKDDAAYPHVPTGPTAIGSNVEGPVPQSMGAQRVDPVYGPVKAEYGTSMATPAVAGAIVLLAMLFGVTTRGEKLDAIVNAIMATLEKTADDADAAGEGFLNVEAAYDLLKTTMSPIVPNFAAKLALRLVARRADAMPRPVAAERAAILRELAGYSLRSREFRSYRRVYNDDVDPMIDEQEAILRRRLEQIDEQYRAKPKGA